MIMSEAAAVLYGNLQRVYRNFNQMQNFFPTGGAISLRLLSRQMEEALVFAHQNAGRDAETRIRALVDVFNTTVSYFPGQVGALFLGYIPGPKIMTSEHGTYAFESNINGFCARTEPMILEQIAAERARIEHEQQEMWLKL